MVGSDRITYLHRCAESRRPTTFGSALEHSGGLSGAGRAASLRTSRADRRAFSTERRAAPRLARSRPPRARAARAGARRRTAAAATAARPARRSEWRTPAGGAAWEAARSAPEPSDRERRAVTRCGRECSRRVEWPRRKRPAAEWTRRVEWLRRKRPAAERPRRVEWPRWEWPQREWRERAAAGWPQVPRRCS